MASGPDPDELDAQAEEIAEQERQLLGELAEARTRLDVSRAELAKREQVAAEAERAHLAAARAEADRLEVVQGQATTALNQLQSVLADLDEARSRRVTQERLLGLTGAFDQPAVLRARAGH